VSLKYQLTDEAINYLKNMVVDFPCEFIQLMYDRNMETPPDISSRLIGNPNWFMEVEE
jgi:hypothetical protein